MLKQAPNLDSLYCLNEDGSRKKIHTADVRGRYQVRKKILWALLIAIYLVLPWIEIGGKPAVLIDIAQRHFYLFGTTFNAQDFYLVFFVVTGIGFTLFVVSALWGRIWCGYGCPHTVFLEGVFRRVERWLEGNAQQRQRLQAAPWTLKKLARRGTKWLIYFAISMFLSHTFLSYFMPVDVVFQAVVSPPSEHPTAFTFILIFTAIIYWNFAWFREQLCIVICPYGRLQSALYDPHTVNVAYDAGRGEPRDKYTKTDRGDCIDCFRCVAVCPTGIDIRNGTQMECVGCANCIDACDDVMDKVGQARGLIRYDSQAGIEAKTRRFWRPRVFFYGLLLLIGMTVFTVAAIGRTPFEANLLRSRGTTFTLGDDGTITNVFQLSLVNKLPETRVFLLEARPQPKLEVVIASPRIELESLQKQAISIIARFPRSSYERGKRIQVVVRSNEIEFVADAPLLGPPTRR